MTTSVGWASRTWAGRAGSGRRAGHRRGAGRRWRASPPRVRRAGSGSCRTGWPGRRSGGGLPSQQSSHALRRASSRSASDGQDSRRSIPSRRSSRRGLHARLQSLGRDAAAAGDLHVGQLLLAVMAVAGGSMPSSSCDAVCNAAPWKTWKNMCCARWPWVRMRSGALAQHGAVRVADALPRGDEPVRERLRVVGQRGQRTVVVVEIRVQVAALEAELGLQRLLVERDPVAADPLLLGQPVVRCAQGARLSCAWADAGVRQAASRPMASALRTRRPYRSTIRPARVSRAAA